MKLYQSIRVKAAKIQRSFPVMCASLTPLLLVAIATFAAADTNESLGNKLLDGLAPTATVPARPPQNTPAEHAPATQPGAEAATPPAVSPLVPLAQVQQGMHSAQLLLAQTQVRNEAGAVKSAGAAQKKVIAQLDELIAQLSKQCNCQGGESNKPPSADKSGPSKPGNKAAKAAGNAPARDSSDRLDRASAKPVDKGQLDATLKHLWGHLPEREREQMLQSFSDEFLPKYQLEIEQYYRRLSQDINSPGTPTQPK